MIPACSPACRQAGGVTFSERTIGYALQKDALSRQKIDSFRFQTRPPNTLLA